MPVPFTDVWEPGETLRTSTLVTLNMINQQQQLLLGYDVKVELVDSQFLGCSMARPSAAVVLMPKVTETQSGPAGPATPRRAVALWDFPVGNGE